MKSDKKFITKNRLNNFPPIFVSYFRDKVYSHLVKLSSGRQKYRQQYFPSNRDAIVDSLLINSFFLSLHFDSGANNLISQACKKLFLIHFKSRSCFVLFTTRNSRCQKRGLKSKTFFNDRRSSRSLSCLMHVVTVYRSS